MAVATHPNPETLAAFARGDLPPAELSAVAEHIGGCAACCAALRAVPDDTFAHLARAAAAAASLPAPAATPGPAAELALPGVTQADNSPPELVDHPRYKILGELGAGGMGVVYKAEHRIMDRVVALKVLAPHLTAKPGAAERFRKEVKLAARLSHANVVTVYDADEAGGRLFLAMEFVEGVSLDRLVTKKGPLAVPMACSFARQAALGLQHAAEKGLTHRDIKPQNLMVTRKGQVKVMDFGLARFARNDAAEAPAAGRLPFGAGKPVADPLTNPNLLMGTPDYLSPEQAKNSSAVDHRSDIYSLGCTIFFLLTGRPPFAHAATLIDKLLAHTEETPPAIRDERPDVPEGLAAVLAKMLAKNPDDRYTTASEAAAALLPFTRADADAKPAGAPEIVEAMMIAPPSVPPVLTLPDPEPAPARTRAALARDADTAPVSGEPATVEVERPRKPRRGRTPRPVPWWKRKWAKIGAAAVLGLLVTVAIAASRGKKPTETPPSDTASQTKDLNVLFVVPSTGLYWLDYGPVKERLEKSPRVKVTTVSAQGGRATLFPHEKNPSPSIEVNGKFTADTDATPFAAIVFCGKDSQEYAWVPGPASQAAREVIDKARRQQKVLAAICLGEAVLAEHGALNGKEVAYNEMVAKKYPRLKEFTWKYSRSVVTDGKVVTASGPDDAILFADALLKAIGAE